jgi:hypothetical protein
VPGEEVNADSVKRYNLVLPETLYRNVQDLANKEHTTVIDILRRFIKLGLFITKLDDSTTFIVRNEDSKEREILFFL